MFRVLEGIIFRNPGNILHSSALSEKIIVLHEFSSAALIHRKQMKCGNLETSKAILVCLGRL